MRCGTLPLVGSRSRVTCAAPRCTAADLLRPHLASLQSVVGVGLRDGADPVRVAALAALLPLGQMVAGAGAAEIEAFHGLVSDTLQVCEAAVRAGAEHVAVTICQLLTDLLEISAPLLARHLPAIVTACLAMGTAASLELETREQALQVLHWVATYKSHRSHLSSHQHESRA